jgi:hypothetical protein
MQSIADRLVVSRRRVCADGAPLLAVGPNLMSAKIAK